MEITYEVTVRFTDDSYEGPILTEQDISTAIERYAAEKLNEHTEVTTERE